jgi:hypothetical protein
MKYIILNIILLFSLSGYGQSQVTLEDLKSIVGTWEGSITYLDYQTNKPFSMAANLIVEKGKSENTLVLNNLYPDEPKANNSEKIKFSKNGPMLNGHIITQRKEMENGNIQILTEHNGKDDNKKALIRHAFVIGENTFLIRKEVRFSQVDEWIKRNELSYNRKK